MSLIFSLSILLRLIAALWMVLHWHRIRDWRLILLATILLTMVVAPATTFVYSPPTASDWSISLSNQADQLPDLLVSILTVVLAWSLHQSSNSPTSNPPTSNPPDSNPLKLGPLTTDSDSRSPAGAKRLAQTAVGIAVIAILGSITVGWLAYTASRQAIIESVANESLSIGQTIVNNVEFEMKREGQSIDKQRAIQQLASAWERTAPPFPGSYLCVIEPTGKLALHTKKPEMTGTDVSRVIVDPKSAAPQSVTQLLAGKKSLATQNTNYRGQSQIVGYAYMPSIDSLVVAHVPAQLIESNIRKTAIPWAIALAMVGGLLIPLSVGLMHHGYKTAQQVASQASAALLQNEQQVREKYSELELIYRTAPVGLCLVDVDLRFVRINEEMASRPIEEYIGRHLRDVSPDIAELIEPIHRRVLDTGQPVLNIHVNKPRTANPNEMRYYQLSSHPVIDHNQKLIGVSTVAQDVTERTEAERSLEMENELLAAVARGLPLDDALRDLIHFIEDQAEGVIASLLLLDADGVHLRHGAATGLTAEYNKLVDGLAIGEGVGSCGTAAFRGEPVFVEDIETDPLWAPYRETVRSQGLRACWSMPIKDTRNRVMGSFALYRKQPGGPTARHLQLMETAKNLASLLLSHDLHERNLRESESRFRTIFEQAAIGVALIESTSGIFVRINRRYCEVFGVPEEKVVGQTWMDLTHPNDLADDLAYMERLRAGEIRDFTMEKRVQRGDGSYAWINLTVSPMWQPGEAPSMHIAIAEDISQRKETQSKLEQSESRYRSLVETAPFGVQRTDFEGRITFANRAHAAIYGCQPEQLIGSYIWDLAVDDEAKAAMREYVGQQVANPLTHPASFETTNRRFDGRIIDVNIDWTYECDADGKAVAFVVIVTDITRRKEAERSIAFQADVLNRVSDAVLVTGNSGEITYANEAASRLFYDAQRPFMGRQLAEFHDERRVSGPSSEVVLNSIKKTGVWQGENEFQFNGEICSFETKLKVFRSPNSDDRFLLSVVRDISARKKASQERRQHRDVLAHMTRLSTMGELVAGIAHEVKQPLYAITNFATASTVALRSIEQAGPIGEETLEELKEWNGGVRDAAKRASEIIQRLREFARKGEGRREKTDVHRVIQDSIDLVAFEARKCQVSVELELAERLPEVLADRIQCEQVVVNLLQNAYEALSESDQPRRVVVRSLSTENAVEVQIIDNGPGIPSIQHGRLFEAFYTTKPGGMGMGLAISRTIVEDHGGRLWGSVNEHGGATFHFTLSRRSDATDAN